MGAFDTSSANHEAVASWFLGPKAENHQYMRDAFNAIVDEIHASRLAFHPEDEAFITPEIQQSDAFKNSMEKSKLLLAKLSQYMAEHNIPFYSPRYAAHMVGDTSLPGTLGYLLTMLYNPNNVAPEASPLTSLMEWEVGQDLCETLGFRRQGGKQPTGGDVPTAWGHITADGSIANLESMWVARNLKFYPLSLKNALSPGAPFHFIAKRLSVTTCAGEEKLFDECSTWELLNLTPTTVLDLPQRLTSEFGMSTDFVQSVMRNYIVQSTAKDKLEAQYKIEHPPQYFVAITKHYSWPKSAAIVGIGSDNLIEVSVTNQARMDIHHLRALLNERLERKQAVYAVVAIIGSTEHGAVDPVEAIVDLRKEFQTKGLSFMIHIDGAWGGYFATLLRPIPKSDGDALPKEHYVPQMALLPYTKSQLEKIGEADSITIDPHKSGYIPYPAGALCWRDERARFLVTWTTPYIEFQMEGVQSMGTYGLEGSKPGAAPVAAWMSHEVIGLHKGGYGSLLGEAMFTAVKMYCHWVTMETKDLIVIPLNMLPIEMKEGATLKDVETQKKFIRDRILNRPNRELVKDKDAMELVQKLGSDLMINAFSCNFLVDGKVNTNVAEANILNTRLYEALSVLKVGDDVKNRELFIMSTVLRQAPYGECLTNFKRRLGLDGDPDLFVLSNLSMSPFPTEPNFLATIAAAFQNTAEAIIKETCIPRNIVTATVHSFVMQGTDKLHLVYLPVFQMATFAQQLIVTATLSEEIMAKYTHARAQDPDAVFLLHTDGSYLLDDILQGKPFRAVIDKNLPGSYKALTSHDHFISHIEVTNLKVIKNRSLNSMLLETTYPSAMPFYVYGTLEQQHIDHILLCSPNIQLSASEVTLTIESDSGIYAPGYSKELEHGMVAVLDTVYEATMQPFSDGNPPNFFRPNAKFDVTLHRDSPKGPAAALASSVLARGTITLGRTIHKDYKIINKDLTKRDSPVNSHTPGRVEEVKTFVKGRTTVSEMLEEAYPAPVMVPLGDSYILDRFYEKNETEQYVRTIEQRSAWKTAWDTEVAQIVSGAETAKDTE